MKQYYNWSLKTRLYFFVRDLFKPRYALIVELTKVPNLPSHNTLEWISVPAIMRVPYKRPFLMPYNQFVNGMKRDFGDRALVIPISRLGLWSLSGSIGSAMSHNVRDAVNYG